VAVGELERRLVDHLEAHGPIGFDEYQANALYAPDLGFYAAGGGAGRRRDFLTSPEVGPLYGTVVARALDAWWAELGRPDPFVVVEAGAGPGTLARTVLAAGPQCASALALTLVETASVQWATHPDGVRSRAELPEPGALGPGPVVVLANELLDNLPVALVERTADGWAEVVVAAEGGQLAWGLRELAAAQQRWCELRAPDAAPGARMPVQAAAGDWLRRALALAAGGRVAAIDYARPTTAELAALPFEAWLRTYADHGRAHDPLDRPGSADITCDVAADQLALVAPPTSVRGQAAFLRAHGIDELVAAARARWHELGVAGGLEAVAARSAVGEAEALLDPEGLGGFTVFEWQGIGTLPA
jgi:SAM-dependent MidA family methyltransferase